MKLVELKTTIHRAGLLPYYQFEDGTKFLLMKPSDPNYGGPLFQIAKGQIDDGESPETCAVREAREELGIESNNLRNIELLWHKDFKNGNSMTIYLAQAIDPNNLKPFDYETGSVEWMSVKQINQIRIDQHFAIYMAARKVK